MTIGYEFAASSVNSLTFPRKSAPLAVKLLPKGSLRQHTVANRPGKENNTTVPNFLGAPVFEWCTG